MVTLYKCQALPTVAKKRRYAQKMGNVWNKLVSKFGNKEVRIIMLGKVT